MQDRGSLDAYAARVLATGTAPGLAVAITDRQRTLVARTYGDASVDHLWPIASIGKSLSPPAPRTTALRPQFFAASSLPLR